MLQETVVEINVGDLCSFESNEGFYMTGRCFDILPAEIIFLVNNEIISVWRGLAEQSTILLEKYCRETVIAELTEELAAAIVA